MSKPQIRSRMKGLFLALLLLTLGVLLVIPMTSLVTGEESPVAHHMTIYSVLLIAWIFLAIAFGIAYLASEGSKGLKPISLPIGEEEK